MPDTTLETPDALALKGNSDPGAGGSTRTRKRPGPFATAWLVGLGLLVAAELLLRWASTRPGYDPYGWLDWGYQTLHGRLDLGGAPSWKPFSYIPNVVYALAGHYALHLWMITAVAVSLAGAVFAGHIAYRLTSRDRRGELPRGRFDWPAIAAAVVAGAAVLGIQDGSLSSPGSMSYFHYVLSAQSDSMIVTFCLAAIDMMLARRLAWAWWLAVYAGLGRPEVFAFTGLYGLWILWRKPNMRWMVIAGALITVFFWFGVPTITNGKPNVAGQLALKSPRELHKNKILGTIGRFTGLNFILVEVAALVAVILAVLRRDRAVLLVAGAAVLWVIVEIAFVLHGFPGVQRYVFEAGAVVGVLAGVAVGWLALDARRFHPSLPRWLGIPLAVVFVLACLPHARALASREHRDIVHERSRTTRILQLGSFINALGGPRRIEACGGALLNVEYVSIMGWYLHVNTGQVAYQPLKVLKRSNPVIYFILLPNGWAAKPLRPQNAKVAGCASLNALYVPTAHHPGGVLIRK
ncbi:MAG: hypothetical protein WBQ18_19455 [Solirubrobacteraceae bacterium]